MFLRRKLRVVLVLLLSVVFVRPTYASVTFDEIRLMDIQPKIGGYRLVIRNNGEYEIQIVKPSRSGQNNREFSGQLDKSDFRRVVKALKASNIRSMKLPVAQGSSASGPIIQVIVDGETISKQKMTGAKHRRFDELYGTLLAIINKIGLKKQDSDDLDIPVLP